MEENMTKEEKTNIEYQMSDVESRTKGQEQADLSKDDLDSRFRGNDTEGGGNDTESVENDMESVKNDMEGVSNDIEDVENDENKPTEESVVEAVLFASDESLTPNRLADIVGISAKHIREHINNLNDKNQLNNKTFTQ